MCVLLMIKVWWQCLRKSIVVTISMLVLLMLPTNVINAYPQSTGQSYKASIRINDFVLFDGSGASWILVADIADHLSNRSLLVSSLVSPRNATAAISVTSSDSMRTKTPEANAYPSLILTRRANFTYGQSSISLQLSYEARLVGGVAHIIETAEAEGRLSPEGVLKVLYFRHIIEIPLSEASEVPTVQTANVTELYREILRRLGEGLRIHFNGSSVVVVEARGGLIRFTLVTTNIEADLNYSIKFVNASSSVLHINASANEYNITIACGGATVLETPLCLVLSAQLDSTITALFTVDNEILANMGLRSLLSTPAALTLTVLGTVASNLMLALADTYTSILTISPAADIEALYVLTQWPIDGGTYFSYLCRVSSGATNYSELVLKGLILNSSAAFISGISSIFRIPSVVSISGKDVQIVSLINEARKSVYESTTPNNVPISPIPPPTGSIESWRIIIAITILLVAAQTAIIIYILLRWIPEARKR